MRCQHASLTYVCSDQSQPGICFVDMLCYARERALSIATKNERASSTSAPPQPIYSNEMSTRLNNLYLF